MTDPLPASRLPLGALFLLALGSAGVAAAWILFAYATDRQLSWVAVIAAFDAAWLLRLGRMRPGWGRAACAAVATIAAILFANWGIAAGQMGKVLGLQPWDSMARMGGDYVWTLSLLANAAPDLAWLGAGVVIAVIAGR